MAAAFFLPVFLSEDIQDLAYLHKLWDELSIIPCKSQKASDLSHIGWGRSFLDGLYFTFISGYSLGSNDMLKVGNLLLEQLKLGWFEL